MNAIFVMGLYIVPEINYSSSSTVDPYWIVDLLYRNCMSYPYNNTNFNVRTTDIFKMFKLWKLHCTFWKNSHDSIQFQLFISNTCGYLPDMLFASHSWCWAYPLLYRAWLALNILYILCPFVRPTLEYASAVCDIYTATWTASLIISKTNRTVKRNIISITCKAIMPRSFSLQQFRLCPNPLQYLHHRKK